MKMIWKYLDNLIGKNEILDLTKDNAEILISEFNQLLKKGNLIDVHGRLSPHYKQTYKHEKNTSSDMLVFDRIEKEIGEEETGVVIRCKPKLISKTNFSLDYNSYSKFAVLKNVPAGNRLPPACFLPIGIYISYYTPKPIGLGALFGWEKEIDPNRRLEYFFFKHEWKSLD